METYAEYRKTKPFDWNEFLDKDTISKSDWGKAYKLAKSWVTCACGNQCALIPRYPSNHINFANKPLDKTLSNLGIRFYQKIAKENKVAAKKILKQIENRSAIIIKKELIEINKKLKIVGMTAVPLNN